MRPFKFAASQAKCIYLYKNLRTKFQRCCADIYFNQQRLKQGVIPKYAQIKVRYTSPASITTHKKMQISRITGVTCSFGPTITFPFPRFAYNKERTRNHEVLVLYVSTVQYSTVQPAGSWHIHNLRPLNVSLGYLLQQPIIWAYICLPNSLCCDSLHWCMRGAGFDIPPWYWTTRLGFCWSTKLPGNLTERFIVEVPFGFWLKHYLIFCKRVCVVIWT